MINSLKRTYNEYPRLFWIVVGTLFVDSLGSTLLFPFFALYITQKFGVGMTQAGILLGMSSLFGLIGSLLGGALADRFGRRKLILFGLVFSALSSLLFGFAWNIQMMYGLVVIVGLLSRIAAPAQDAMMADILPESKRQEGFGITRIAYNYAWIIGTALGGLIAAHSFMALFVLDAVLSLAVAAVLFRFLPETRPAPQAEAKQEDSLLKTAKGYRVVLRDIGYILFTLAGMLVLVVYQQQYSSLAVYLKDVHDISPRVYGIMLSVAGLEVVIFQLWISRQTRKYPPFLMMVLGSLFFMAGFAMIGFVQRAEFFLLSVITITLGEMIMFPTNKALAINFSPADMRGRYMAVYDLGWTIPATLGPAAAGLILDNFNPNLLWVIGGILCAAAAAGFYVMHLRLGTQPRFAPEPAEEEVSVTA
jgi:predicted MFS family arabinose efflux permease